MATNRMGLGRGLSALISDTNDIPSQINATTETGVLQVNINKIEPSKDQPRKHFDKEELNELSASILAHGVIQPIIVKDNGDYFSIVAGERRWRASKLAGLKEVPVIIKDYSNAEMVQIALIENIQRSDLNPIEEALCYKRLIDDFLFNQNDIAEKISKSRSSVNFALSLLKLDERVQRLILENRLPVSFGKLLLKIENPDDQYFIADMIVEDELSVKSATSFIDKYLKQGLEPTKPPKTEKSSDIVSLEDRLNRVLTANVKIKSNANADKGKILIDFNSKEELDRLLLLFNKISDN